MADPYHPGYDQPSTHQTYQPSSYVPPQADQYASGALTTRHHSNSDNYYPSQSNMQLTQSSHRPSSRDSKYLDPTDSHRHHRHDKSRSNSRHDDRHSARDRDHDRERSKSRTKEWGSTAVGAAAGGLLGNELGHGPLATIGGLVAGAYGAHELERRHEKHREKKRLSDGGGRRGNSEDDRHHRRRSSGGLLDGLKNKVEGFLDAPDKDDRKRRSRSHVGGGRRDYDYDDGYDERRGGRSRRDDYY